MAVLAWVITRLSGTGARDRHWRLLVGTGFCGALTTFSTLQVETITLAQDGHAVLALGYATASLVAGMTLAIAVTVIVRRRSFG